MTTAREINQKIVRILKSSISTFWLKMGVQALGAWQTSYELIIKICISRKL